MSEQASGDVILRPARPSDIAFVVDSWLKSNRRAPWHNALGETAYFQGYKPIVRGLLERADTKAVIACNAHDEDQIFGYAVWSPATLTEPTVVHYVYVKDSLRKLGIARQMVTAIVPAAEVGKPLVITALGKSVGPECRFGDLVMRFRLQYEPYRLWSGGRKAA